ncbi:zinc metalloprotease [Paucibacter sp. R3-3]|uniref:Zinc metalloprotease n=1 Tax=Roseateles agri TaxID=3098619 RepID=A0ABU5DQW5_9BURK|nr:zinc metalloprotease [Paucibacter sp. R3-3]MDY0748714.1 zinc metalloprotease [Paucibacter sp. R3-3]
MEKRPKIVVRTTISTTAKTTTRRRMCGATEVHARLCEEYPEFRVNRGKIHAETEVMVRTGRAFARVKKGPVTIPVVVHVVYRIAAENISQAQVQSQIAALNRDYAAANEDKGDTPACWRGLVTNIGVQFKLANKDPEGKVTDGITRTKTKAASFSSHDEVKFTAKGGADAWPTDQYLNLWVCSLGEGLLGYAQFPGGPAATDGVVILNTAFGTTGTATAPYNLGRTAVHEVGHWLNLNHIWGDTSDCSGTDHVDDTPDQQLPNYGKPAFPHVTCQNGPNGDMFMNYMDYVDDDAMVMFTAGQSARMHATLTGPRKKIGT